MALLASPGVQVSITDQSQYLPAAGTSVPFVMIATAANKANPNGVGLAQGTVAANKGKLYQVTSQRDLTTLYGNPTFYSTSDGTPIQGDELNEYGLLAAYSVLGATSNAYVLRADIDLASLAGQSGRPTGEPDDGTYWLDTTTSTWGIYEWNATTQAFTLKTPIVITSSNQMDGQVPSSSIGSIGDYAVAEIAATALDPLSAQKTFFHKSPLNVWNPIGSPSWLQQIPTVTGTNSNPTLPIGDSMTITLTNGASITVTTNAATVASLAGLINSYGIQGLGAAKNTSTGALELYSSQRWNMEDTENQLTVSGDTALLTALGIDAGNYIQPQVAFGTNAQMPLWQSAQAPSGTTNAPTGSIWIKINSNNGLNPIVKSYNATTGVWVTRNCSLATSDWVATEALDATGGQAIAEGSVYAQYNYDGGFIYSPLYIWKRAATGPTIITGTNSSVTFTGVNYIANVYVSTPGSTVLAGPYEITLDASSSNKDATDFVTAWSAANIQYTSAAVNDDGAIVLTHTEGGEIVLNDYIDNVSSGFFATAGFTPVDVGSPGDPNYVAATTGAKYGPSATLTKACSTTNITGSGSGLQVTLSTINGRVSVNATVFPAAGTGYAVGNTFKVLGTAIGGATPTNDITLKVLGIGGGGNVTRVAIMSGYAPNSYTTQLSNWQFVDYIPNEGAPTQQPASYTNWYWSVVNQVDIMVNTTSGWVGYRNAAYDSNGFPKATGSNVTDPNGPIISATIPTVNSEGDDLVYGDLWIDTSAAALEYYPKLSRWQELKDKDGMPTGEDGWVLIDNSDQTSSNGMVFADARWATNGSTNPANDPIPSIKSLLSSDYLDLDAPSNELYPVGMLLFNTRRSGYNVKQYRQNYLTQRRFPDQPSYPAETAAWVSASGLQGNGAAYMGRQAQRAMVVQSLKATMDTNQDIRDEDNAFNLMATPNYPELQPNMVLLNQDRGETTYILGDTPLGLPMDATAIQAWANNLANASSTGEYGCVTRNIFLGLFYPSGITNDLSGKQVVVPPSHMMLRTFIRNDTIAYPWFAAAGTTRGTIDNATNIGYLDRVTGEFQVKKTPLGIRNVLYTNFINPLVNFTGNGLLNYGNKTSKNTQSAQDRTNVARLVAYIRRQLTIAARPFVFEPNDAITRQQISGVVETLMVDLVAKRGIYDYSVRCDETNNPPSVIDRSELWIDVAVEPVKAAEFIYIPVRILNTGELGG